MRLPPTDLVDEEARAAALFLQANAENAGPLAAEYNHEQGHRHSDTDQFRHSSNTSMGT